MLRRLAAHCYKHRWRVLISWVVLLVGVNVLAQTVGGDLLKTFSLPGSESQSAFDVLKRDFARKGDTGDLVFKVNGAESVTSPRVMAEIQPVMAALVQQPHVVSVSSPYDPANARFISSGGKIAYAEILFDVQANDVPVDLATHMRDIVSKADKTSDLQIELAGSMFTDQTQPASEAIGILAAIFILLIAFGSLLAMGLPIMTALFGIGVGLAFVTLLARVLDIPSFAPQVTAMIGIGVGIDYALFISTRYREALHDGADPERAVVHAIDTSGRAVLFAGSTVVISLLGLFVIGVSFIRGLAVGASLAVLVRDGGRSHVVACGTRLRRLHHRQVRAPERQEEALGRGQLLDPLEPDRAAPAVAGRDRRPADPVDPRDPVLLAPPRCGRCR